MGLLQAPAHRVLFGSKSKIAIFFYLGAAPFLFRPHPLPDPSGCARISVTESHFLITAEGEQNMNDFLTRISSSK